MTNDKFDLKYTICFPLKENQIMMIQRVKHPWKSRWNGAGGKIKEGENPKEAIYREILEEAQIDLKEATSVKFAGIVTWDVEEEKSKVADGVIPGMYVYIAELSDKQKLWEDERKTREGIIAWKPLTWVCHKKNTEVAGNIPYFLSAMLSSTKPIRYHCAFDKGKLIEVDMLPLPTSIMSG